MNADPSLLNRPRATILAKGMGRYRTGNHAEMAAPAKRIVAPLGRTNVLCLGRYLALLQIKCWLHARSKLQYGAS
jgi:hypothetical protein